MILGIGSDIAEIDRVEKSVLRFGTRFLERVFTPGEIAYCQRKKASGESFAARFAAKEALAKALGSPGGMLWHDAEVVLSPNGQPSLVVSGTVAARAETLGVRSLHVSLSHDGGIASAVVIAEA